jgi:hypothetical protein
VDWTVRVNEEAAINIHAELDGNARFRLNQGTP